jgi:NAD(P)-dependent dehydrogenase (short-subunit alcohol dehydrogenase family)
MLDPKGRVAIVTGKPQHRPRHRRPPRTSGFRIAAAVRDPKSVDPAEDILVHRYDAERAEDAPAIVAATLARFGRIDALINAAGISSPRVPGRTRRDRARQHVARQRRARPPIRAALPSLREAGDGRVITSPAPGKRVANENFSYQSSPSSR